MNNNIPTYEILDTLQEQISTINIYRKQGNLISLGNQLTTLLESLDELIARSLVVFLTLDLKNEQEEDNGDYQNEDYKVTPTDMIRANKLVGNILLRIVSGELIIEDGHDDERMDQAAKIIAHLSGRAIGSHIRTWMIPYIDPNGNIEQFQIKLHEPGYTGNGIGFKTWGAAPLLSKKLIQENLISDIKNRPVLELGTGTGMIGIICEKLGAPEITLTDYHPKVLENAKINVELNECQDCYITPLDFIEFAKQSLSNNNNDDHNEWKDKKYSVVIASDLLYEMDHAEHLPIAVEKLMENDFYFLIPLRDTHWKEVNRFEEKMKEIGLYQRIKQDTILQEDEGVVKYRYYEYSRLASP
ncbi:putative methyltransferase-domain-containing protein [Cunninghamella echinulata]|nr:putative methyltransferase-domain-containing protein [Cunninghamella echinulata]